MKKASNIIIIFLLALGVARAAPALEFSADVIMTHEAGQNKGKMFVKGEKVRIEGMGNPMGYSIIRGDKKVMWMIMPQQKMYMEIDSPEQLPFKAESLKTLPNETGRRKVGSEKIDGRPCTKYLVTQNYAGKEHKMHLWIAEGVTFPVKMSSVDGKWSIEYRNIKSDSVPDDKFQLPGGLQKFSMPKMGKGMGPGTGPGMVPGMPPGMGMGRTQ